MRLFYNHNMLSLWFSLQVINTYLHNIQLVLVHLPCKVTFIIFAMKQLNYSVLSSLPFSFSYFLFIWCHISFYQRKNYLLYMCVLVTQSCPTFCNHMACSPPGSSVHGILQARILEWVAILFSREFSQPKDQTWVSHIAGRFFLICTTTEVHS